MLLSYLVYGVRKNPQMIARIIYSYIMLHDLANTELEKIFPVNLMKVLKTDRFSMPH